MHNERISFKNSYELYDRSCQSILGGTTQSKTPENYIPGEFPLFISKAKGSYLWDVDGNKYIDYIMGYGSISLGYCIEKVDNAAIKQIREGFVTSLTEPIQTELSELLVDTIPCAERVQFFKSGSDTTSAAVRIARIHTGRNKIIRWGYNGWHDWCSSKSAGIPSGIRNDIYSFRYNDLNSLEEVFMQNKGEVAAVIMMPFEIEEPDEGFLQGVKKLCHNNGALFILDEMRTGFRMTAGGAQQYYGVIPDMATFSKAMANGYAVAALAGKEEVMRSMEQSRFSATFFTNTLEMAAAIETIKFIKKKDTIPYIWRLGERFSNGLKKLIKIKDIEAEVVGVNIMPYLIFTYDNQKWFTDTGQTGKPVFKKGGRVEKAWNTFYRETTQRGVLFHPNHHWYFCSSHTEEDIDYTLNVCETALELMRKEIK